MRRTPLLDVQTERGPLWLKCENLQPMGAFKLRGATNMLAQLSEKERRAGVVTYSSGNHGLAVAVAARALGTHAVVTVPETIAQVKLDGMRRAGAEVIYAGTTVIDRRRRADQEVVSRGLTMVPPFDHPWIIAGQGTTGLEILEQQPDVSTVYVPIGGGGLASGVATALKLSRPGVRVIGVEPAGAPKVTHSLAAGHPVTLDRTASIADGLLSLRPGELAFAHLQRYLDAVVTIEEDDIAAAVRWLFSEARLVAEPSGAVSVAAALAGSAVEPPGLPRPSMGPGVQQPSIYESHVHPEVLESGRQFAGRDPRLVRRSRGEGGSGPGNAGPAGAVVAIVSGGNVDPERYIDCLRPISPEPSP
ncbi:MAG TPA: threonine/serine dehydratase [Vicinamibacterales bacterium]|nr:threonine/serine dehydratase [Vicinamibacterales bacterium]